jgi:hypothetical protein
VHRARLSAVSFIWGLRGQTIFWKIDLYDLNYKSTRPIRAMKIGLEELCPDCLHET